MDMNNIAEGIGVIFIGLSVAIYLLNTCRILEAIEICKECLVILNNKASKIDDSFTNVFQKLVYQNLFKAYLCINNYTHATKCAAKVAAIHRECGERSEESNIIINMGAINQLQGNYCKANELFEGALLLSMEIGDPKAEARCYVHLGTVLQSVGEYDQAMQYHEKALGITKQIGDKKGEAACYTNMGALFGTLSEYVKAIEYLKKALTLKREIGDRNGEALTYANLGNVYGCVGDYVKAINHLKKSLAIKRDIDDRNGEALCYGSLGAVYESLGEYVKAKKYLKKSLTIKKELGDINGEASCYLNLGRIFQSLKDYVQAREYLEKGLKIKKEIGDRNGEASCCISLATVLKFLSEYVKAKSYLEKALTIKRETGERNGESRCYIDLGSVLRSLGEYVKAKHCFEKALAIKGEIGDKFGESSCYQHLGIFFESLDEHSEAKEYLKKALTIKREIGDKNGEASCYLILGAVFLSQGEYPKAAKYLEKSLGMKKETGDKTGEAKCYGAFAQLFREIGDYSKSEKYLEKSLAINKEIGNKIGEAGNNTSLGILFCRLGDHVKAEEYIRKGLALFEKYEHVTGQLGCLCSLAFVKFGEGKTQEAISYLRPAFQKAEHMRSFLEGNDEIKILFTDVHGFPYWSLSFLFCVAGNVKEALYVSELGRARALADLMSAQYFVDNQMSAYFQTWVSIERIVKRESNCTFLYISYLEQLLFLWILKPSGVMHFLEVNSSNVQEVPAIGNLDEFFVKGSFRNFGILPGENCEDRSLNEIQMDYQSFKEHSHGALRKNDLGSLESKQDLSMCYKMIIAPVADLLAEPEVIIVPDRSLCSVPFAALPDGNGKFLAEKIRIRSIPSLSTLGLIQDSPADYHSQRGALIVGNPDVGKVRLKGRCKEIPRLPWAENEAIVVGGMLGVQPLLGKKATKQAVLEEINSVSLIHFAAHGDAEKGEILLAPSYTSTKIPQEEDYLLTMSEISQVQLRAKLVVLSCCHSARGQVKAEGVVGIARAFLGSGARSVLVALWALNDNATEHFMRCFYEHLVRGESASECLHQAMNWMRDNGYPDVRHWAPFVLIGDNVTFDFKNKRKY